MTGEEYEMEKIRAELAQERQMKDMLEQSSRELQLTVDEYERNGNGGLSNIDGENNEWKTRYVTQVECNQQLSQQIGSLAEKVEDARETYNKSKLPKSTKGNVEMNEVSSHYVKQLERERHSLSGQLRDLEWRLDQESKAYHKANEERKQNLMEINAARKSLDHGLRRSTMGETPRGGGNMNIPQDQRVLDPRYGPIKKTAAVKSLPYIQ